LLQHAEIPFSAAESLFQRLLQEIELWLSCGRVHADLSPFNILYWDNQPTVLDFLQSADPETNSIDLSLLSRDIANLCRFFARFGVRADAESLAAGVWRRQRRRAW